MLGATQVPRRIDEQGKTYSTTADDAACSRFVIGDGIVVNLNSSFAVIVHRKSSTWCSGKSFCVAL